MNLRYKRLSETLYEFWDAHEFLGVFTVRDREHVADGDYVLWTFRGQKNELLIVAFVSDTEAEVLSQ